MKFKIDKKNIMLIFASVSAVALCIGVSVWYIVGRKYETGYVKKPEKVIESKEESENKITQNNSDLPFSHEEEKVNKVSGVSIPKELNVDSLIKKAYEIKEILAVDKFNSVSDISVNRLVQYAFCYLYSGNKCLVDYKPESMIYCKATKKQIEGKITELFGSCPIDVERSQLYNRGNKVFEMWQPDYSQPVYYSADISKSGNDYIINSDYFADKKKKNKVYSFKITVAEKGGKYIITSFD